MIFGAIILLFLFVSGDFCATTVFGRKFGEITPCTVLAYGLIVYIAGVFRCLNVGIVLVFFLAASLYIFSVVYEVRKQELVTRLKNLFSVPFICFIGLFVVFLFGDFGQMALGTDDPGHWMDCVKVMTYSGEFYANPETYSTFPTYPPMMAMIQLLVQKGYLFVLGGEFCEWLMLFTYHMTVISLFLPICVLVNKIVESNKFTLRRSTIINFCFAIILCVTVTVFFRKVYSRVGIDPFLACEGAVLFLTILYKERIKFSQIYICLLSAAVVLTKDMGLLFAVFGLLYLVIDSCKEKKFTTLLVSTLFVIASKVSWNHVIQYYGAIDPKPNEVDWVKYIKVLFGVETYGEPYKNEAIAAFKTALIDRAITLGYKGVSIKYLVFISILVLITIGLCVVFKHNRKIISNSIVCFLCFILFYFGLGGVYVDKFVYTEALSLASYERYVNTLLCVLTIQLVVIFSIEMKNWNKTNQRIIITVCLVILAISPIGNTGKFLLRIYPKEAKVIRAASNDFSRKLVENCEPGSTVYFLAQSDYGTKYIYVKFMIRPYLALQSVAGDDYNWCFVDEADPNNIYFKEMHLEDLEYILFESSKYDYFALMRSDDYFRNEFADAFSNPAEIADYSVYWIDKENKCLRLVSN